MGSVNRIGMDGGGWSRIFDTAMVLLEAQFRTVQE